MADCAQIRKSSQRVEGPLSTASLKLTASPTHSCPLAKNTSPESSLLPGPCRRLGFHPGFPTSCCTSLTRQHPGQLFFHFFPSSFLNTSSQTHLALLRKGEVGEGGRKKVIIVIDVCPLRVVQSRAGGTKVRTKQTTQKCSGRLQVTGLAPTDRQPGSPRLELNGSQLGPGVACRRGGCVGDVRLPAHIQPFWGLPQPPPRAHRRALPQTGTGLCSGTGLPSTAHQLLLPGTVLGLCRRANALQAPFLSPPLQRLAEEDPKGDKSGTSPPSAHLRVYRHTPVVVTASNEHIRCTCGLNASHDSLPH